MRITLKTTALAVALAALPIAASAAGLGKLTVLSALGQPLKVEVDISASRDEIGTLSARVAPAAAFKQQGIDYVAALSGVRMAVAKRPNGQPYIRITSERSLNEPFLDLLVELSWGSGRLMREYTFLLDPPVEVSQKAMATPVAPPETRAEGRPVASEAAKPMPAMVDVRPDATAEAKPKTAAKPAEKAADSREVKRGDTLGRIAAELKPAGVNLDQMLVALLRGNKDAFDGDNMNRLRAGKILKVPEPEQIAAVDVAEARKTVVAQASDFNAYRRKLAEAVAVAPAVEEAPKQAAVGKITPKVEDKVPAAPAGKDKLEVSRTESAKDAKSGKMQGRVTALEEDLVARDRALKEANSRVADLEKNVAELKKLAELKSQGAAQLQQQAQKPAEAKKPEPVAPPKVVEAPKLVEPPKTVEPPKMVEAAKPADVAKPVEAKPAEAAKPVAPPKKKFVPPPPPPEPSFMEENGPLVLGGGGVVALLLGYLGFAAIRKKRQAKSSEEPMSALSGTDLSANSVFGTTGGQSVDTGAALHTDFGQGPSGAEEGVDPVAEADVYMAYGRDAQAEEILIEALKTEPTRLAIHLKLLEIYSARHAERPFETLATDLKGLTGGSGPDWEKAAAMGRALEPNNPLYSAESVAPESGPVAAAPASTPVSHAASTVILTPDQPEKMQATVTMPGQLANMAAAAEANPPVEESTSLDFDLDLGGPAETPPPAASETAKPPPAESAGMDFDLDLGAPAASDSPAEPAAALDLDLDAAAVAPVADLGIDFSLDDSPTDAPATPATTTAPVAAAPADSSGLDFDFDIGAPAGDEPAAPVAEEAVATPAADDFAASAVSAAAAPQAPPLDLGDISLDLGEPETAAAEVSAEDNPEVATKLELALAYEEMGDKDGARELLQEVLTEGSAGQQEAARARLEQLA
ncbi:MAG: pilus assembly protein [Gammaproteobacteria bacterium]|nr:pilus assembly protein [Gammaproteobacteria bacterium]MBU1646371.1 pilus assembly protein [Gammaproteobacteria bacterium]MBU1970914.1 pilus assembly protein [Gammaproteobacteria bacterium]